MKKILVNLFYLRLAGIIMTIMMLLLCNMKLFAQEQYLVNGRTLEKIESIYFELAENDTLQFNQHCLFVIFKTKQEETGLSKLLQNSNYRLAGKLCAGHYVLTLLNDVDFIESVLDINNESSVEKTMFSYYGQYCSESHLPNDPKGPKRNLGWYFGPIDPDDPINSVPNVLIDQRLYLNKAWDITTGDPSIITALLDAGTYWQDAVPDFPPDNQLGINIADWSPDTHPHGTHGTCTTSIISSRTNNNKEMAGIAGGWTNNPVVESEGISPMMIVIQDGGYPDMGYTALAIQYAAEHGARIINMPFSWDASKSAYSGSIGEIKTQIDLAKLVTPEIIFIASAGNDNSEVDFPANYDPVIAVSACNENYELSGSNAEGSNYGPEIFCTAPGTDVISNNGNGTSGEIGLTSSAAAIVSGVVSLVLSVNPCLTRDGVKDIMRQSCYKPLIEGYNWDGNGRCDQMGFGFINAAYAVNLAKPESSLTIAATENVTWTTHKMFKGNITLAAGATLTLQNMTLEMGENNYIFVSRGAKLTIDHSTITALCNSPTNMWQGIYVDGTIFLPQNPPTNQGYVVMKNNATISNAISAITCDMSPSPTPVLHGGGLIRATNSHFYNNELAVDMDTYPGANLSTFINCSFTADDTYPGQRAIEKYVNLEFTRGVTFQECLFENKKTTGPEGIGINAIGSGLRVIGKCHSTTVPCPEEEYNPTVFKNLRYGIYAMMSQLKPVLLEHLEFRDNTSGMYLSDINYASILKNEFFLSGNLGFAPYGAYLDNCTGYHIEENEFTGGSTSTREIGLYIRNSGTAQNYVYRNHFNNLIHGTVADGMNRDHMGLTGLCYKCNTFSNSLIDIEVVRQIPGKNSFDGIAYEQGKP
ncbi:MAG: S8 family serine peptidase, partial [Bacteroidales bacterium]